MENTFYLEVELETRPESVEIRVDTEGVWNNDGIGPYEFWGQRCYDAGRNYFVINTWNWNKVNFSPVEVAEIESQIEKHLKDWEDSVEPTEKDYPED